MRGGESGLRVRAKVFMHACTTGATTARHSKPTGRVHRQVASRTFNTCLTSYLTRVSWRGSTRVPVLYLRPDEHRCVASATPDVPAATGGNHVSESLRELSNYILHTLLCPQETTRWNAQRTSTPCGRRTLSCVPRPLCGIETTSTTHVEIKQSHDKAV